MRSETFDDFTAQTQAQSSNGYVLSALTSIQNLNRTWFYGAYQKGTGSYQLLRTSDPNAFQQAFTQYQGAYTLVELQYCLGTRDDLLHDVLTRSPSVTSRSQERRFGLLHIWGGR